MGTLTQNGCQRWKTKRSQSRLTLDWEQSAWANEVTLPGLGSGGSMDDALSGAVLSKDLGFSFRAPELKLRHPKPHGWLGLATSQVAQTEPSGWVFGGRKQRLIAHLVRSVSPPPSLKQKLVVAYFLPLKWSKPQELV